MRNRLHRIGKVLAFGDLVRWHKLIKKNPLNDPSSAVRFLHRMLFFNLLSSAKVLFKYIFYKQCRLHHIRANTGR